MYIISFVTYVKYIKMECVHILNLFDIGSEIDI